jgi:hypothetical protein
MNDTVRGAEIVEKEKALEMALGQIEKQFGKGSIMRQDLSRWISHWVLVEFLKDESPKFMVRNHRARRRSPIISLQRHKKQAVLPLSSMPNIL